MILNTEAQLELNENLLCEDGKVIIETAKEHGAIGWKINGAGGEGGSITLFCGGIMTQKREIVKAIEDKGYKIIPIVICRHGVKTWETTQF